MKKIKIFLVASIFGFFISNIIGSQAQAPTRQRRISGKFSSQSAQVLQPRPVISQPQTSGSQRKGNGKFSTQSQQSSSQQRTIAQPTFSGQTRAPITVDPLTWAALTEEQKRQFNSLKNDFEKTVATQSKYALWQNSVIEKAKKIININTGLMDYCIDTIKKELEKTEGERNIDAEKVVNNITSILQQYVIELCVNKGTEKEQFNCLMTNVLFGPEDIPFKYWINEVIKKAKKLVFNKELTIVHLKKSLIDAITMASGGVSENSNKIIQFIIAEVDKFVQKEHEQNSPVFVQNRFDDLLLNVGKSEYWDISTNRPNVMWIEEIIKTSKNMIKIFNISLNDIEQQIGSQLFFVATKMGGKPLYGDDKKNLIALVTNLKQKIGS